MSTPPYTLDVSRFTSTFDPKDEHLLTSLDERFFDPNYDPLPEIIDNLDISIDFTLTASQRAHQHIATMSTLDVTSLDLPPPPDIIAQMGDGQVNMMQDIQGALRTTGFEGLETTLARYERSLVAVGRILDSEMHVNKHRFIEGLLNASELHQQISGALTTSAISRGYISSILGSHIRSQFMIIAKARSQKRLFHVYQTLTRIQKQIDLRSLANSQYQRRNLASYIEVLLQDQRAENDITSRLSCLQQWSPSALLDRCTLIIEGYFTDVTRSILTSVDNSRVFSPDLGMMISFLRAPILIASFGEIFSHESKNQQKSITQKSTKTDPNAKSPLPNTQKQSSTGPNSNRSVNVKSSQPNNNDIIPTQKLSAEAMSQLITKQFFELEDQFLGQIRTLLAQCSQGRLLQQHELLPSQPGAPTTAFLCKGIGSAHFSRLIKTISTSYMDLIWFLNCCLSSIETTHAYCMDMLMREHFIKLGQPYPEIEGASNNINQQPADNNKKQSNLPLHADLDGGNNDDDNTTESLHDAIISSIMAQFTKNDIMGLLQPQSFYDSLSPDNKKILAQEALASRKFNKNKSGAIPIYGQAVCNNFLSNVGREALNGISDLKAIIYNLSKNITKQCTNVISDLYTCSVNLSLSDIRQITPIIFILMTTMTLLLNKMNAALQHDNLNVTQVKVSNPQLSIKMSSTISIHALFQPLLSTFFLITLNKFKLYQTRIFTNIRELLQGDAFVELEVGDLVAKIPDLKTLLQLQFEYDNLSVTGVSSGEKGEKSDKGERRSTPNKHPFAIDCDSAFTFLYSYFLSTVNLASNKEFRLAVTMLYNTTTQTTSLASSQSSLGLTSSLSSLQVPALAKLKDSITITHNQRKQLEHCITYLETSLTHRDPEVLLYNHPEYLISITTPPPLPTTVDQPHSSNPKSQQTILPWNSLSDKAIAAFGAIPEAHQMFRFLYDTTTFTPTIPPATQNIPTIQSLTTLQQQGFPLLFGSNAGRPKDSCSHQPTLTSSSISVFKTICSLLLSSISFSPFQDFFFQVLADSIELYVYCIASSVLSSSSVTYTVIPPNPNNLRNAPQPYQKTTSSLVFIAQGKKESVDSHPIAENDGYDGWDSDDDYPTMSDHRVVETALFASTTRIASKHRLGLLAAHNSVLNDGQSSTNPSTSPSLTPLVSPEQSMNDDDKTSTTTHHSKDKLIKATLPYHSLQALSGSGLNLAGGIVAELYPQKAIFFPPPPTSSQAVAPWLQYPRLHRLIRTFVNHVDNNRFGNVFDNYSTSRRIAVQQLSNVSSLGSYGLGSVSYHDLSTKQPIAQSVAQPVAQAVAEPVKEEKESLSSKWGFFKKKFTSSDDSKAANAATAPPQTAQAVGTVTPSQQQQSQYQQPQQQGAIKSAQAATLQKISDLPPPEICQLSPIIDLTSPDELYGINVKITSSVILMQLSLLVDALAHLSVFSSTNNNTASMFVLQASDLMTMERDLVASKAAAEAALAANNPKIDDLNNINMDHNDDNSDDDKTSSTPIISPPTISSPPQQPSQNHMDDSIQYDLETSQSMVDIIQEKNSSRQIILKHLFNSKQLLKKTSVELLVHSLSTSCHEAVESLNIPSMIKNTNYTLNQIAVQTSPYVQTIKTKFSNWFTYLGNQKMCSCFILPISAMLSYSLSDQLIIGLCQANKITDEGKMLLSQDISMLYDFLSKAVQIRPLPFNMNITELIAAMYLDQSEIVNWINTNGQKLRIPKSSALQLLSVNAMTKLDKTNPMKVERIYEDFDMRLESVKTTLAIMRKQKMDTLLQGQKENHRHSLSLLSSQSIPPPQTPLKSPAKFDTGSFGTSGNSAAQSGSVKALMNSNIDKFTEYMFRIDQFQTIFYATNRAESTALLNHPLLQSSKKKLLSSSTTASPTTTATTTTTTTINDNDISSPEAKKETPKVESDEKVVPSDKKTTTISTTSTSPSNKEQVEPSVSKSATTVSSTPASATTATKAAVETTPSFTPQQTAPSPQANAVSTKAPAVAVAVPKKEVAATPSTSPATATKKEVAAAPSPATTPAANKTSQAKPKKTSISDQLDKFDFGDGDDLN